MKGSDIVKLGAMAAGVYAAADVAKNILIKPLPQSPESDEGGSLIHTLLYYLDNPERCEADGVVIDDKYILNAIAPAKKYIDGRFDCQDFRMPTLLRLQYLYGEKIAEISPHGSNMLKHAFLNAKFWMTEPGDDSTCYWSENHQLLFAVSEYLAGKCWQNEKFSNDGATGKEHAERGKKRINIWMEHRFRYGYGEFNSTNYYLFDLSPASNFIQFAAEEDSDMVERMKMCVDLLFYDVASGMFDFSFIAPTARAYVDNMVGEDGDRVRQLTDYVWALNENYKDSRHHQFINFLSMMKSRDKNGKPYYEVPQVIKEIGLDKESRIIKSSTGLDVSELPSKGLVGQDDNQIMMQFGMEAFTNPEVIFNTMEYLRNNKMFSNDFLNLFKAFNLKVFQPKAVIEGISKNLNPMPNGVAQQRANLYAYRTADYRLGCVRKYHPGSFGAQQMLSLVNFGGKSVVFTLHPAKEESAKSVKSVPGYWAGYGRAPHIDQYKNIQLQIYKIPKHSGFLEMYSVPQYTHTFLPEAYMDEVKIDGRYAFARKGNALLAIIGIDEFVYKDFSPDSASAFKNGLDEYTDKKFDLIQQGNRQFSIYELSALDNESFEDFQKRIKSNKTFFDGDDLVYLSGEKTYELKYDGDFSVNGEVQGFTNDRFESDYINASSESPILKFRFNGKGLTLDYEKAARGVLEEKGDDN